QQIRLARVTEQADERRIHVEKAAIRSGPVDPVTGSVHQLLEARLAPLERARQRVPVVAGRSRDRRGDERGGGGRGGSRHGPLEWCDANAIGARGRLTSTRLPADWRAPS